ncbi:60S ribosomal protein L17-2-like protein [Tanacetum coccineum]|uniref:60S ribosomal protein L17-2-like protein n=1 Tax=Tanacetum coccineum TaxID=301880 RepID=A0ABQ4XSC9_9ASTR
MILGNAREIAHALRGMPLIKAKRYLEDVLAHKQAIPFTRLCRGNADIDVEVKGLDVDALHISHIQPETQTDSSMTQAANHNFAQYWISTRKV